MHSRLLSITLAALIICAAIISAGLTAEAQQGTKVLVILSSEAAPYRENVQGFKARFPGEVETVVLPSDTGRLAERIRSDPPSLILSAGSAASEFAAALDPNVPVLFTMVYYPERHGLTSRAHVCGISLRAPPDTVLPALAAAAPGSLPALKVGVLHSPGWDREEMDSIKAALEAEGHTLITREVASPENLSRALKELLPRIDALWLLADPAVVPDKDYLKLVIKKALDNKVAVVGLSDAHVKIGALVAVSVDYRLEGEAAARFAQDIINGKDPAKVGVKPPQNLIWSLNQKVASEIGWEVPAMTRKKFERIYP